MAETRDVVMIGFEAEAGFVRPCLMTTRLIRAAVPGIDGLHAYGVGAVS